MTGVKFIITATEKGKKTLVNISAHDSSEPIFAAPYDVAAVTVSVEGFRPRGQSRRYLAEIIAALNAELGAEGGAEPARVPPVIAELEGMEPLPFSEIGGACE